MYLNENMNIHFRECTLMFVTYIRNNINDRDLKSIRFIHAKLVIFLQFLQGKMRSSGKIFLIRIISLMIICAYSFFSFKCTLHYCHYSPTLSFITCDAEKKYDFAHYFWYCLKAINVSVEGLIFIDWN